MNIIHTKVKEPSLLYYLPIADESIVEITPFPEGISTIRNAESLVQDLNSGSCVHFLRR